MKSFIVFAALVAAVAAAPQTRADDVAGAQILRYDLDNIGVEGYRYSVETSNGIKFDEQGQLQNVGAENEGLVARGQFSYVGDDGVTYSVQYTADEDGFRPVGEHIPKAK